MSEAIVVGGGLAGSAFAIELARQGRPVVVLEKTTGAHHKVCGEFLSAEAQALLARLGLDVWQLGARPAGWLGLEFGGRNERLRLPFRGAGLSRFLLDQALLDAAVARRCASHPRRDRDQIGLRAKIRRRAHGDATVCRKPRRAGHRQAQSARPAAAASADCRVQDAASRHAGRCRDAGGFGPARNVPGRLCRRLSCRGRHRDRLLGH